MPDPVSAPHLSCVSHTLSDGGSPRLGLRLSLVLLMWQKTKRANRNPCIEPKQDIKKNSTEVMKITSNPSPIDFSFAIFFFFNCEVFSFSPRG